MELAAGIPLLTCQNALQLLVYIWVKKKKRTQKQPTQNYLKAFFLDPLNLFCTARSIALEWLFLFKAIFVVELLQTPESCKQKQEPKNVSLDLKFTSALVTRTKNKGRDLVYNE